MLGALITLTQISVINAVNKIKNTAFNISRIFKVHKFVQMNRQRLLLDP